MNRTHPASPSMQLSLLSDACDAHEAATVRVRGCESMEHARWHDASLVALQRDGVLLRWNTSGGVYPAELHQQLLEVRFGHRGAQYGFIATAQTADDVRDESDRSVIKLAMPVGIQRHDRRRNARVTLTRSDDVTVVLTTVDEPILRIDGWVMDLSRGGLAMRVLGRTRAPAVGAVVRTEISLPGEIEPLSLLMMIKRHTPLGADGDYALACMVIAADDQYQYQRQFDRIDRFVETYRACLLAAASAGGTPANSWGG